MSTPRYSSGSFARLDERFTVTAGYVHIMEISNEIRAFGTEYSTKGILVTGKVTLKIHLQLYCIQSYTF